MSRDALRQHLLAHSVRRGEFTLKSGKRSTWFLDSKQTLCRPEGLLLVADAALAVIPDEADAIGGLTMGADPVAFGIAAVAATRSRIAELQRAQGHEGPRCRRAYRRRARTRAISVVITEDTVTRGTSMLEAARVVREYGAEPVLLLAVVDRGGTCAALAADRGHRVHGPRHRRRSRIRHGRLMAGDDRPLDAVTFDFWNTLVSEVGGESMAARRDAWFRRLAAAGLEVEAERIEASFAIAWTPTRSPGRATRSTRPSTRPAVRSSTSTCLSSQRWSTKWWSCSSWPPTAFGPTCAPACPRCSPI